MSKAYIYLLVFSLIFIASCNRIGNMAGDVASIEPATNTNAKSGEADWDNMEKNVTLGSYFGEATEVIHFQNNCFVDDDYPDFLIRSSLTGSDVSELSCLGVENKSTGDYYCIIIAVPKGATAGKVAVSVNFITFGGCLVYSHGAQKATAVIEESNGLSVKLSLANDDRIYLAFDMVTEGSVFEHVEFGDPLPF